MCARQHCTHRYYFRNYLGHVVGLELERTLTRRETYRNTHPHLPHHLHLAPPVQEESQHAPERKRTVHISKDMVVRRTDIELRPVDPNGMPSPAAVPSPTLERANTLRRRAWSAVMAAAAGDQLPVQDGRGVFGGFPGPGEVLGRTSQRLLPELHHTLQQTFTMPRTATLMPASMHAASTVRENSPPAREVPYLSFRADVGKNSRFKRLSEDQLLELGGVEYSALNALMWIVPLVSRNYYGAVC